MKTSQKSTIGRKVVSILGINIDSSPEEVLLNSVFHRLQKKQLFFIVTPNPEIVLKAQRDPELKRILNTADISLPDGTGLLFAAKILGLALSSRIPGRVFMMDLIRQYPQKRLKIFLLGSSSAVIDRSIGVLKLQNPHLQIEGVAGPKLGQGGEPVNNFHETVQKDAIEKINQFKPDILFIGFGAPKQEKWFELQKSVLRIGGAMVVGGSFDVVSGYKKTPPVFFDKMGIEWLWRLLQEPHRFLRIFDAVVLFPFVVFLEKLRNTFK